MKNINKNAPVGVFDSGVGGMTVVREIIRQIPDERIVYFGDTARVPYGSKSKETVLRYARQVRQTSGLSTYPEFNSVTQTITIDGDWNLISIDVRETYKVVAFGVPASCTGTLLSVFDFSPEELTFPILP